MVEFKWLEPIVRVAEPVYAKCRQILFIVDESVCSEWSIDWL